MLDNRLYRTVSSKRRKHVRYFWLSRWNYFQNQSKGASSGGKEIGIWRGWISLNLHNSIKKFSSFTHSCLTLWPHGLEHARSPCPSPTPRVYSNSSPLSRWCHPTMVSCLFTWCQSLCTSYCPVLWCFSSYSTIRLKVVFFLFCVCLFFNVLFMWEVS